MHFVLIDLDFFVFWTSSLVMDLSLRPEKATFLTNVHCRFTIFVFIYLRK